MIELATFARGTLEAEDWLVTEDKRRAEVEQFVVA